jgi:hypothetical protein
MKARRLKSEDHTFLFASLLALSYRSPLRRSVPSNVIRSGDGQRLGLGQLNMKVNNSDLGQNYIPGSGAKRGIASDSHRCWQTLHARNFEKTVEQPRIFG